MSIAISVKNLGKSYLIRHHQSHHYATMRDLLTDRVRRLFRRSRRIENGGIQSSARDREWFWALNDVSFDLRQGQRLGIIGKNGAGKSTLLKILTRITEPTKGRVSLTGRVASLLEVGTGFHPELTGRENIFLNGVILGMRKAEIQRRFDAIVDFSGVERFLDTPVKRYSSGMYVRLAFAVAAHVETEILIVDEVLAVGDIRFRQKCLGKMNDLRTSGRTIVFVSHDMSMIRQLCSEVIWLNDGALKTYGDTASVAADYEREMRSDIDVVPTCSRAHPPIGYHLCRVELRNVSTNALTAEFQAGDTMEIHLWANGHAPVGEYTVEFLLLNEMGERASFGAANPVQNTYFERVHTHFICRLGPMPLTSGKYSLNFSIRVWGLERWDSWEQAISFRILKCDLFGTGHDVPSSVNGSFIMPQVWRGETE